MTTIRGFERVGYLCFSALVVFLGCKNDGGLGVDPDSAVGGSVPDSAVPCGELNAAQAATLATARLESFGTSGLGALAGLEHSRSAARLLTFGYQNIIGTFVTQSQSSLHDSLAKFHDEQLVPSNVESVQNGVVTFLLSPQTVCGESEYSDGSDSTCVKQQTDHPIRLRISRIACDQGDDSVAIELWIDTPGQKLIVAELYRDRAEIEFDLGALLRASNTTSTVSSWTSSGGYVEQTTTKPLVSAATGSIHATLVLNDILQATGTLSVSQAIDFTTADDNPTRVRLAAGTNVATLVADGAARTATLTLNVGAFDMRESLAQAVWDYLGMDLLEASDEDPVDIHIPGLRGEIKLASNDVITATQLDLGGGLMTMMQGNLSLLSVNAAGATQAKLAATLSAKSDETVALALPAGLAMAIAYGFEPIMSNLYNPANYLAKDTLSISAPVNTAVTLAPESSYDDPLAITDSGTGTLLLVNSGTLSINSALWPGDNKTVSANQCLSRSGYALTGHNDLLSTMQVAACMQ
jgi:hypothetical protein